MIVWNPEPTEYGDFNGLIHAINSDVSVERVRDGAWSFHVWGPTGVLMFRSDLFYRTADEAKRAAEEWARPSSPQRGGESAPSEDRR